MKNFYKKPLILISAVCILTIMLLIFKSFTAPAFTLTVVNHTSDKVLAEYPASVGDVLRIKFKHSYDKGVVWEDFIFQKNGHFLLKEVVYNVPSYDMRDKTYPKASRTLKDGFVHIENIDEFYSKENKRFLIRVPYTVPQWLIFKKTRVELTTLASSGTLLEIYAHKN